MTGIINEQRTLNPETTNEQNTGHVDENKTQTCLSPVYSLPDEDKLFTQTALACKENFINNIQSHSPRQNVDKGCFNDSVEVQIPVKIVDLYSDEEDNRVNIGTVDVDVHRSMSNLSLTDTEGQTEIDESQSVLRNFEHVTQPIKTSSKKGTKVNSKVHNGTITKVMNHTETKQQPQNILDNFSQNKTQPDNIIHQEVKSHTILQNTSNNAKVKAISLMQNMTKYKLKGQNVTNISKSNEVTKTAKIKTVECTPLLHNKSAKEIIQIRKENVANDLNAKKLCKKRKDKNKSNEIKAVRHKRKTIKESDRTKNGTNKLKKSNICKRKVDVINNRKELKSKNEKATAINTEKFNNNSINANSKIITTTIPKIYNKKIEDDLSFVENIRYVRQITANEFDLKFTNIEKSFWDNLTFPSKWNDQDFNLY